VDFKLLEEAVGQGQQNPRGPARHKEKGVKETLQRKIKTAGKRKNSAHGGP